MMVNLYFLFISMLVVAGILCSIPLMIDHSSMRLSRFFILFLSLVLASFGLYFFSTDHQALTQWFNVGKPHYDLLMQFDQLGGVEGAIKRIQAKLKINPNDAQGWYLLSKLYLIKHDDRAAAYVLKQYKKLKHI